MVNMQKNIIDMINSFKVQLIINKNLYSEDVISKEYYEITESNILNKIQRLSNELEMV